MRQSGDPGAAQLLARAIDTTRDGTLGPALVSWLRVLVPFDHSVLFGYRGAGRPVSLFETFSPAESQVFVALYQNGPYLLDPFYQAAASGSDGFWRMRELAPDRFYTSEYFRSYYSKTRLAEEVGFFVPLADDSAVVLSLMRLGRSGAFKAGEATRLREAHSIVASLCRRRWEGVPTGRDRGSPPPWQSTGLDRRLWRGSALTSREDEVVDLVLQGHSTESIARRLHVAPGTVKVHRRNIHRKLGVRSQAELFGLFVDMVAGNGSAPRR